MISQYFYHKSIRKFVSLFGTLFNDISIHRTDSTGKLLKAIKVPISYGNKEKFLVRLQQDPRFKNDGTVTQIQLPRISFEIQSMSYDSTRKLKTLEKIVKVPSSFVVQNILMNINGVGYNNIPTVNITGGGGTGATATANISGGSITSITITNNGTGYTSVPSITFTPSLLDTITTTATATAFLSDIIYSFVPVPYNFDIEMNIMVKNSDDGTQILEQILPFYTPDFIVNLKEFPNLNIIRDIPITLTQVTSQDTFDGSFLERRAIIHTLNFELSGHIYGPEKTSGVIRDISAKLLDFDNSGTLETINTKPNPLTANADDDFGFTQTIT